MTRSKSADKGGSFLPAEPCGTEAENTEGERGRVELSSSSRRRLSSSAMRGGPRPNQPQRSATIGKPLALPQRENQKAKTGGQFRAAFGLATAFKAARFAPDPPDLENVTGNNRGAIRAVAKVLFLLCGGRTGAPFFVGSIALGKLFGKPHRTALRWLKQLEAQGVIRRTWAGGKCRRDKEGSEYAAGALVNRASEYEFGGLPKIGGAR